MNDMKIGLPDGQPEGSDDNNKSDMKASKVKKTAKVNKPDKKVDPNNINWRDNGDTISAKIRNEVVHINKINFNIQLKNGFIIKCGNLDKAKAKAILLFNN